MARLNWVQLLGEVKNEELTVQHIAQPDGGTIPVINMQIQCFDEEAGRCYNLPVAVWSEHLVSSCLKRNIKAGDILFVQGELRYHFKREGGKNQRVYTSVKTETVEFVSRETKQAPLRTFPFINSVKLMGNLVEGDQNSFVVAIDRLVPSFGNPFPKSKTADFVTVVNPLGRAVKGSFEKGAFIVLDGRLMTRPKQSDPGVPRVVVGLNEAVGYR